MPNNNGNGNNENSNAIIKNRRDSLRKDIDDMIRDTYSIEEKRLKKDGVDLLTLIYDIVILYIHSKTEGDICNINGEEDTIAYIKKHQKLLDSAAVKEIVMHIIKKVSKQYDLFIIDYKPNDLKQSISKCVAVKSGGARTRKQRRIRAARSRRR
jgi:cellulose biosynthesis protein BcsQ